MNQPPYRELFGFRPTTGSSPLLLILGKFDPDVADLEDPVR